MQNCLLEKAKESWNLRLVPPRLSLPYIHLSPTGMNPMNLPWKLRSCEGSHPFRIQDSHSMSMARTLPLSLKVLTPLNWTCPLPWNRESCSGKRGITPFRNTSHSGRAGKEKTGEKKEMMEDSQLCCSTKEYLVLFEIHMRNLK